MRLPAPLLRLKKNVHKNDFGHVLILAGSPNMLGAAALCALSAMRSGAGLVTAGVPQSLNLALQKKISPVVMTMPLKETKAKTIAPAAYQQIKKTIARFNAVALGPGLSQNPETRRFILKIISSFDKPLVIDADALNALSTNPDILKRTKGIKILTPHPGEMSRLTKLSKNHIEASRVKTAKTFSKTHRCVVLLKGNRTVVASPKGKIYVNKTGNAGMATAGSGDILTGMIAAFLAQGLNDFDAAKYAAYVHGKAGDLAARQKGKTSLMATDIIEKIPQALRAASG